MASLPFYSSVMQHIHGRGLDTKWKPDNLLKSDHSFFYEWFRVHGSSYAFIFKKNLSVTNIQFAELATLVKRFTFHKTINSEGQNNHREIEVQFVTAREFIDKFELLQSTYFKDIDKRIGYTDESVRHFSKLYSDIFESMIVIESFYGSCNVYVPHNLFIDLACICFYSGYIHSCGQNIYTRKVYKAKYNEFADSLRFFLRSKGKLESALPFTAYCHEDFTPFDREEDNQFTTHGLDDIKFYIEKSFMNDIPLSIVLKNINEDFRNSFNVSEPGDYHINIQQNSSSAIFLITDRSIEHSTYNPGKDKYFVCYEQVFINENPFQLFDENKPAWIDHVTIPHTLMGAMLNLGLFIRPITKMRILDPFVGSGTTQLELAKYSNVTFEGSDLSPLAKIVSDDNILFFNLSESKLKNLQLELYRFKIMLLNDSMEELTRDLDGVSNELKPEEFFNNINRIKEEKQRVEKYVRDREKSEDVVVVSDELHKNIIDSLNAIVKHCGLNGKHDDRERCIYENLSKFSLIEERIIFYLGLKALIRKNIALFVLGSTTKTLAFIKELDALVPQVNNLIKIRVRSKNYNLKSNADRCIIYKGNYSNAVSIIPAFGHLVDSNLLVHSVPTNAQEILNKIGDDKQNNQKFDLVITDPPYGYNTKEDIPTFSELYIKIIEGMIKCLNDLGQIIICLPEWSYTGRQVPYFAQKHIIIHQVYYYANLYNMDVINPYKLLPQPSNLFSPPYFWQSEKALKRSILHFMFKKRNSLDNNMSVRVSVS